MYKRPSSKTRPRTRIVATSTTVMLLGLLMSMPVLAVDLVGIHDIAVSKDPQLRAAALRRDASGENTDIAWANFYPQLSASFSYDRGNNRLEIAGTRLPDTDIDRENYRVDLTQSIFNWQNYGLLSQARAQVSVAEADYNAAYQNFLLRVSESYFNILTAEDSLTFAQAEEKALQRQFEQAEQRFEVGLTAVTDVLDARASYDQARARVIVAENTLQDAYEALRELTGTYFEELQVLQQELPLESPDPANAQEWVDIALNNNPTLESSRQTAEVAESNIRIQRSGHFPTLDLVASYNRNANNAFALRADDQTPLGNALLLSEDAQVGIRLNVPIFSGFRVNSQTRQAGLNFSAALQDVEFQERATVRSAENSYRAVLADIREVEAREQAVISAKSALDSTQAGFDVGTRTIVDVLLSEQRFFQAQRDYSQARHTYILDQLRLKQAAGVLVPEDLIKVNTLLE